MSRLIPGAFALLALCAGFGALELGLRALWPQEDIYLYEYRDGYVFNRPGYDQVFAMSPTASVERLRKHLPDWLAGTPQVAPFFKERITTNRDGMRDDRVPSPSKEGARPRLLILGDSISFGWPVSIEEGYPKQFEKILPAWDTVNCSLIGTSTAELLTIYEKNCRKYQADVTLVQIVVHIGTIAPDYIDTDPFGPDYRLIKALWRARPREIRSYLEWDADGIPHLKPAVFQDPQIVAIFKRYYSPRLPLYKSLNLVRFVENRWFTHSLNVSGGDYLDQQLRQDRPSPVENQERIRPTLRYLAELKDGIEKDGSRMLVLFFPTSYQARANILNKRPEFELLKETLKTRGIPFIDVGSRINASNIDEIYYEADHHPKAAGYRLIAEMLAEGITPSTRH